MSLRLYSTLSRTVEEFRPAGDEVRTYVCGVTPYDTAHLGHAFLYVAFDVLHRFLGYLGYKVRYIQNITDIDNDILRRANELNEPWDELGNRYVKIHQDALDAAATACLCRNPSLRGRRLVVPDGHSPQCRVRSRI